MHKKLYKMMNWPQIESVIYSDGDRPSDLLGAHRQGSGTLVQAFFPNVNAVTLIKDPSSERIPMEMADEDGYYACFLPDDSASALKYHYEITEKDGTIRQMRDPYGFPFRYTEADKKAFGSGVHYEICDRLGAHLCTADGCEGAYFTFSVPNASRVSVVGDFNNWDGRVHQMTRFGNTDVFEIFVPGVTAGACYQYEIRTHGGELIRKADPFAFAQGPAPVNASVVCRETAAGNKAAAARSAAAGNNAVPAGSFLPSGPISVYEFDAARFSSFAKAAEKLPAFVKKMGFNCAAFRPFSADANTLYSPDRTLGTPDDLALLVDAFHKEGIAVIFEWNPVSFEKRTEGLEGFAGSGWMEYSDPRKSETPDGKRLYFDLSNPRVCSYLIANALYLVRTLHADGLLTADLAPMLYLDYGKQESGFTPNIYGDARNLEAIDFLKKLNTTMAALCPGTLMIARESAEWDNVTGSVANDGLGFDLRLEDSWKNDFLRYMSTDPLFRRGNHELLTNNMVYHYTDSYMLPLDSETAGPSASAILRCMPGENPEKMANLRLFLASMMVHPGAKLISLGETLADITAAETAKKSASPEKDSMEGLRAMLKDLNELYRTLPALSQNDGRPDGFEWIINLSNEQDLVAFLRKGNHPNDFAYILINYSGSEWKMNTGVPYEGRYKEIFCSSAAMYGGSSSNRLQSRMSEEGETDGRAHRLKVTIPALSLSIFTYSDH